MTYAEYLYKLVVNGFWMSIDTVGLVDGGTGVDMEVKIVEFLEGQEKKERVHHQLNQIVGLSFVQVTEVSCLRNLMSVKWCNYLCETACCHGSATQFGPKVLQEPHIP